MVKARNASDLPAYEMKLEIYRRDTGEIVEPTNSIDTRLIPPSMEPTKIRFGLPTGLTHEEDGITQKNPLEVARNLLVAMEFRDAGNSDGSATATEGFLRCTRTRPGAPEATVGPKIGGPRVLTSQCERSWAYPSPS